MDRFERWARAVLEELVEREQLVLAHERSRSVVVARLARLLENDTHDAHIAAALIELPDVVELLADDATIGAVRAEHEPGSIGLGAISANQAMLEAAIYEAPEDLGLRRVYGDCLLERTDDPSALRRGELIALAIKREAGAPDGREATDRRLARQEAKLTEELSEAFFAEIDSVFNDHDGVEITWRWGFIDALTISTRFDSYEVLRVAMFDPSTMFLRELALRVSGREDPSALPDLPPSLRALDVRGDSYGPPAPLAPLFAKAPRLRSLRVRGEIVELGDVAFPELRTLEVSASKRSVLASLERAKLPSLEQLSVPASLAPALGRVFGDKVTAIAQQTSG